MHHSTSAGLQRPAIPPIAPCSVAIPIAWASHGAQRVGFTPDTTKANCQTLDRDEREVLSPEPPRPAIEKQHRKGRLVWQHLLVRTHLLQYCGRWCHRSPHSRPGSLTVGFPRASPVFDALTPRVKSEIPQLTSTIRPVSCPRQYAYGTSRAAAPDSTGTLRPLLYRCWVQGEV